jgi:isopropylmalate/homocitrate/citramalate synthase
VTFKDVTLREGVQAAPVAFSPDEQREIAQALCDLGVTAIQAGFAGRDDERVKLVRALDADVVIEVIAAGWDPAASTMLASAFEAGADMCGILMRSSPKSLASVGLSNEQAAHRLEEVVAEARSTGFEQIRVGLSYASEAEPSFRDSLYALGVDAGATAIGYADTPGTATPAAVAAAITEIATAFPDTAIHAHMHNDFGLAVANTVVAIESGASWADVSINGLGERAGNCPLEELAMALELLYGVNTNLDLAQLYSVSTLVARLSGQTIPSMKPIVGEDCFTNKLDLHVAAAVTGSGMFEPFDPALIGRRRQIKLGYGSGPAAVRAIGSQNGFELSDDVVALVVPRVNRQALEAKRCLTDDEFRTIVEDQLARQT